MTQINDIVNYYSDLLIMQYRNLPRATAHVKTLVAAVLMPQTSVQTVSFSAVPTAGQLTLSFQGHAMPTPLDWNSSAATTQTRLQATTGLAAATTTGSPSAGPITLNLTGVTAFPAPVVAVAANTLTAGGNPVTITIAEVDVEPLPQAVRDGFNLSTALGVQLDWIASYLGVSRASLTFGGSPLNISDAELRILIQLAIIKNYSDGTLSSIQALIAQYFPNQLFVFDNKNMQLSYYVSAAIGSANVVQAFVTEGLLPKPMGVQLASVIYASVLTTFFGFRSYPAAAVNVTPFNSYTSYSQSAPWLSYQNAIKVVV